MTTLVETPFRVYRLDATYVGGLRSPDELTFLGAADSAGLGDLLLDLRKSGRIEDDAKVGILYRPDDDEPGEWIVKPWRRRERR